LPSMPVVSEKRHRLHVDWAALQSELSLGNSPSPRAQIAQSSRQDEPAAVKAETTNHGSSGRPAVTKKQLARRAELIAKLQVLDELAERYRAGSRKLKANQLARESVSRKLAKLDQQIGPVGASTWITASTQSTQTAVSDTDQGDRHANSPWSEGAGDTVLGQKECAAHILNLEALLEQHRPYTADWFRLNDMLAEARAAMRGDGGD